MKPQYHPSGEARSYKFGSLTYLNKEDWDLYNNILNKINNNPIYANKSDKYKLNKTSELFEETRKKRNEKRESAFKREDPQHSPPSSRTRTKKTYQDTSYEDFYKTHSYSSGKTKSRPRLNTSDPGAGATGRHQTSAEIFYSIFTDIPEEFKVQFYNLFLHFPNHFDISYSYWIQHKDILGINFYPDQDCEPAAQQEQQQQQSQGPERLRGDSATAGTSSGNNSGH